MNWNIWISFLLIVLVCNSAWAQKQRILLDADTGNEVDDVYALSRALLAPEWEVTGLNATQWEASHWAVLKTMENSHRLNQVLLSHMGLELKTFRGGVDRMFDWGDQAQHSAAAYEIISQAHSMPEGEKLSVVALGALTNVASAVYIDPEIADKIRLYWVGTSYDFEEEVLRINDFNCVMDIQALDYLLWSSVEMQVMPLNVAVAMTFDYAATEAQLRDKHPLGNFLIDRWYQHLDGGQKQRVIWDLALIEALLHPEWAELETIVTSKDHGIRELRYYKAIDVEKMKEDFFDKLGAFMAE